MVVGLTPQLLSTAYCECASATLLAVFLASLRTLDVGRSVGLSWKDNGTPDLTTSRTWESSQTFSQQSTNWKKSSSDWNVWLRKEGYGPVESPVDKATGWWLVNKILGKYVFLIKYLSLGRCFMGTDGLKYRCEDPLLGGSRVRGKILGLARAAAATTTSGKLATGVFLPPSAATATDHCCCCPCRSRPYRKSTPGIGSVPVTTWTDSGPDLGACWPLEGD